jgi:hypothetical protein
LSQPTDNLTLFQNAVQGIYRLFRVARLHDVNNDAVDDSIAAALDGLGRLTEGQNGVLLLFARDTVLVNGQLLPMPPEVWETAMALQKFLAAADVNSLWLGIETDRHALRTLLRFFRQGSDSDETSVDPVVPDARGYIATGIRVRRVADALVVGIESPELSESERSLLTYALAVRGVRTLSEEFKSAPAGFSSYFKRVAWQLSRLPISQLRQLIDVGTIDRDDTPTRVVQAALIASLMARLLDADDRQVSSILLAALQLDASDARDHLTVSFGKKDPAIDAVVLQMYLNGLRGDSANRAVIAFETRRLMDPLRRRIHRWGVPASLDSYILATARVFTETYARAAAGGLTTPVDAAISAVRRKANDPGSIAAMELLALALGSPGPGAAVQFKNQDTGVVLESGPTPGTAAHLNVLIMSSTSGNRGKTARLGNRHDLQLWGTPTTCERPPAWEHPPPDEVTEPHLAWVQWLSKVRDHLQRQQEPPVGEVPAEPGEDSPESDVSVGTPQPTRLTVPDRHEEPPAALTATVDEPPESASPSILPEPTDEIGTVLDELRDTSDSDMLPLHSRVFDAAPQTRPRDTGQHALAIEDALRRESTNIGARQGLSVMAEPPLILRMDADKPVVPVVETYDEPFVPDPVGPVPSESAPDAAPERTAARSVSVSDPAVLRMPATAQKSSGPAPDDFLQRLASQSKPSPTISDEPHAAAPPIANDTMSAFERDDTPAAIELLTGRVRRTAAPPADPEWIKAAGLAVLQLEQEPAGASAAMLLGAGVNRRRKRTTTGSQARITGSGSYVLAPSTAAPTSEDADSEPAD